MLGALAAALLLAGAAALGDRRRVDDPVPGVPLLLAGLMVLGATLRVRAAGRTPAPSAPPVERGCDGCVCGLQGGCAAAGQQSRSPPPRG